MNPVNRPILACRTQMEWRAGSGSKGCAQHVRRFGGRRSGVQAASELASGLASELSSELAAGEPHQRLVNHNERRVHTPHIKMPVALPLAFRAACRVHTHGQQTL